MAQLMTYTRVYNKLTKPNLSKIEKKSKNCSTVVSFLTWSGSLFQEGSVCDHSVCEEVFLGGQFLTNCQ
ncbi:hypothetical protein BpHYR1_047703 [Brachionus plicatilis]|uniref:Uncharacterized protein n=1 Tax=Brachionus plicatilis TaxID=10195 RepID=A0A3M7RY31_BRAPC|nr:hypothetical protein BpHYR1_047703 [Brachionus plicatilis]